MLDEDEEAVAVVENLPALLNPKNWVNTVVADNATHRWSHAPGGYAVGVSQSPSTAIYTAASAVLKP